MHLAVSICRWPICFDALRFDELQDEAVLHVIHLEDWPGVRVVRVVQHVGGRGELETGLFDFRDLEIRIDPMERLDVFRARTSRSRVVDDSVYTAGLERLEN